ncbi:MFS transporter [Actinocorallia sp. B10E7]|uniref:MFS transporter n=1 Tax=Actinocorallia sp. B10E7 TaxID=3153558 RepID=UPI00325F24A0
MKTDDHIKAPGGTEWRLQAVSLIDSVGSGLYLAGGILYFTKFAGLGTGQVGLGLSLAGLVGFLSLARVGWIADRVGPRRTLMIMNLTRAAGFCAYAFTDSLWEFVVISALLAVGDQTCNPLYQAVVERVVGPGRRVRLMAKLRVMYNVGYTVGAGLATVALAVGSREAFIAIFLGNALTFVLASLMLRGMDAADPAGAPGRLSGTRLASLRDLAYLRVAALNGVVSLHMSVLFIATPLWAIEHTDAPRSVSGPLLIVNTVLVVLLQVRFTADTESVEGGLRALRRAGAALAASCGLYALAALPGRAMAVVLLVGAVVLLTVGELFQAVGGWSLSYTLAPEDSRAEYLSTFSLGTSAQYMIGPAVVTVGVIGQGTVGWLALGGLFALASVLLGPAVAAVPARGHSQTTGT